MLLADPAVERQQRLVAAWRRFQQSVGTVRRRRLLALKRAAAGMADAQIASVIGAAALVVMKEV